MLKKEVKKVVLSAKERDDLNALLKRKKRNIHEVLRAKILLSLDVNSDKPMTTQQAADEYKTSRQTVAMTKKEYLTGGLEQAIYRKKRETPPVPSKITGDIEARIIQLACSAAPEGYVRWTLRLLTDKAIELKIIDSIANSTVHGILKKTNLSLI